MKCLSKRSVLATSITAVLLTLAACSGGENGSGSVTPASIDAPLVTKAETPADASRFLAQSTFGPSQAEIDRVMTTQFDGWIDQEFAKPYTQTHLGYWQARKAAGENDDTRWIYYSFWKNALSGSDALRQRVAFALSQIMVVSLNDMNVSANPRGVAHYFDLLGGHAFGNFRNLLQDVTLNPMMGLYLSHLKNQGQGDQVPDENYAREVMQLFTIGLYDLNPDGTTKNGADGRPIETYGPDDVTGIAKIFTGYSWAGADRSDSRFNGGGTPSNPNRDIEPMQPYPQYQSEAPATFLGITCPAGVPTQRLQCALDRLFTHPNTAPFIAKQMIQRLVTSNPSPAYVARAAAAFADNGAGVRGDMKAMLRRILLDPEARNTPALDNLVYGKPREPLLRMTALLRATESTSASGKFEVDQTDNPGASLGQTAMRSPSVFNFWRPGYVPPNSELSTQGLVAPELQTSNETSVAGYLNTMQTVIESGFGNNNPRDVQPTLDALVAIAHDSDELLNRIELVLTSGKYRTETRTRLKDVINSVAIPPNNATQATNARRQRVRSALYLTIASPEFLTQK